MYQLENEIQHFVRLSYYVYSSTVTQVSSFIFHVKTDADAGNIFIFWQ